MVTRLRNWRRRNSRRSLAGGWDVVRNADPADLQAAGIAILAAAKDGDLPPGAAELMQAVSNRLWATGCSKLQARAEGRRWQ